MIAQLGSVEAFRHRLPAAPFEPDTFKSLGAHVVSWRQAVAEP
jgi:hypothetical protein